MSKSLFAVIVVIAALVLLGFGQLAEVSKLKTENEQQRDKLAVFENCPLPPKGHLLVIEGEWIGQQAGEHYRCMHVRRRGANQPTRSVGSAS